MRGEAWLRRRRMAPLSALVLALFSSGTPGAFLDANDWGPTGTGGTGVVFQDLSGAAVTAMEQPVQLILDKSQGLRLGSELSSGSNFTGWTNNGSVPFDTYTATTSSLTLANSTQKISVASSPAMSFVAGKLYKVAVTVTMVSGACDFSIRDSALGTFLVGTPVITASGTYYCYFVAPATQGYLLRTNSDNGSGAQSYVVTNVSVKPIAGNHAYVSASANRPTISARYNNFIKTEALDDANWIKYESTIDTTKYTAPDGTLTAQRLLATTVNNNHYIRQAVTVGGNGVLTFYAAPGGYNYCSIASNPNGYIHFDLTNGNVSTLGSGWASATCVPAANGFYKITVTASAPQTWVNAIIYIDSTWIPSGATSPWSGAGDPTKGILLWHPDLRPSDQATGLIPQYQRVNTATDYDWSPAFPPMIRGNGSNQYLTGNLDLSGTNKVTVWAGMRKNVDLTAVIFELSPVFASNNGSLALLSANSNTASYSTLLKGTGAATGYSPQTYTAPSTNVLSSQVDLSAATLPTICIPRVNGIVNQGTPVAGATAGGNFGNYPYYLLSRAGTSLFMNGGFNVLIVLGAAATAAQISTAEAYCNQKLRAY